MQTFLPYADFEQTARVLHYKHLGKQRVEARQVHKTLMTGDGWRHHPCVKMWKGCEEALLFYSDTMIKEWVRRGYKNTMKLLFTGDPEKMRLPRWLGDESFHRAHRSNLVRKRPDYYGKIFTDVDGSLPYVWPRGETP